MEKVEVKESTQALKPLGRRPKLTNRKKESKLRSDRRNRFFQELATAK